MEKLSLNIPSTNNTSVNIPWAPRFQFANDPSHQTIGYVLSQAFDVVFLIAGFLMIYWLVWGVFQYLFAGGNKEGLAKARARITWAIVGFMILVISFAVSQYAQTLIPSQDINPVKITEPK